MLIATTRGLPAESQVVARNSRDETKSSCGEQKESTLPIMVLPPSKWASWIIHALPLPRRLSRNPSELMGRWTAAWTRLTSITLPK